MITLLDGGMGRELSRIGAPFRQPEWSALALMEGPDFVRQAHDSYVAAGADVLTTNAYACVPFHIGEERFYDQGRALINLAGRLARESAEAAARPVRVAGCIPPLFGSYNPDLFDGDKARPILMPLIEEQTEHVDFWLVETISSLEEGEYVVGELVKTGKPVWAAFTLRDYHEQHPPQLRSRRLLSEALDAITNHAVEAVLFNCSQPETMLPAIKLAASQIGDDIAIGAYANAFDEIRTGHKSNEVVSAMREDLVEDTSAYTDFAKSWVAAGATIIGGCCGIGPDHIADLHRTLR